jgi:CHASE2 domain-containing sensor protein/tRNA A-37 threonylcarbamoyl transferase component Bud32
MLVKLKNMLKQPVFVASTIVGVLMVGMQQTGVLEPLELKAYDQMTQQRDDLEPDNRILIVAFTEEDIQTLQQPSPNGENLAKVLGKLEDYGAKIIGLDFFRDVPVGGSDPTHSKLLTHLQESSRIIPICSLRSHKSAVPPPKGVKPENAAFADIPADKDGVIRRNLMIVPPKPNSKCSTPASLGFQLAIEYLGIQPQFTPEGYLELGKTVFKPLQSNSGGYQNIDDGGFQILLNYRSENNVAQEVSFTDVLKDNVDRISVKDRIVLIGSTAPSSQDIRNTPYSDGRQDNISGRMPGVVIHAHMISQVLDAVLGVRPLFWFLPQWGEILWIWGWTLGGAVLAWYNQNPLRLLVFTSTAVIAVFASSYIIFVQQGWVPVASPLLGFLFAEAGVITYTAFYQKREKDKIASQIEEQKETISLLQKLIREGGSYATEMPTGLDDKLHTDRILNKRYKIKSRLGSGGFSYTYLAEDIHRPGKPVCVVKHLQPARNDEVFLQVARRLFKTEAEILDLVGEHEQIPKLMAYFEENQQFYLVQEYIEGHSLLEELTSGRRKSEDEVIDFLKDTLPILVYIHNRNVIHRDIKPSNLMRRKKDNRIILIDFGAVKQIQPQVENHTVAVGTIGYAPPEQFMGHPTISSDIYALGMIAIQALTGTPAKQLERDPQTTALIWRHLAEVTEELATVLDKMVSYHHLNRYHCAEEVLLALETVPPPTVILK